jgi:hypothetical protein
MLSLISNSGNAVTVKNALFRSVKHGKRTRYLHFLRYGAFVVSKRRLTYLYKPQAGNKLPRIKIIRQVLPPAIRVHEISALYLRYPEEG